MECYGYPQHLINEVIMKSLVYDTKITVSTGKTKEQDGSEIFRHYSI